MAERPSRPEPVAGTGALQDLVTFPGWDPFEDLAGPMYETTAGPMRCAMQLEDRHCNTGGIVHGGLLMSFADFATFAFAREQIGANGAVTVSMTSDFTSAARAGDVLEAEVTVVKTTRSMVFTQGRLRVADNTVMAFSAVLKKLGPARS